MKVSNKQKDVNIGKLQLDRGECDLF